jgi:hypothetical protein
LFEGEGLFRPRILGEKSKYKVATFQSFHKIRRVLEGGLFKPKIFGEVKVLRGIIPTGVLFLLLR